MTRYEDEVNLQIQKAVFAREMGRKGETLKLLNSVEAIQEVSPRSAMTQRLIRIRWPRPSMELLSGETLIQRPTFSQFEFPD